MAGPRTVDLAGGQAVFEEEGGVIYLGMGLRNAGAGIALLHSWNVISDPTLTIDWHADPGEFRRLIVDLYIPAGGVGYFTGTIREPDDRDRVGLMERVTDREAFAIDLLYGDQQGRQHMISRFVVLPDGDVGWSFRWSSIGIWTMLLPAESELRSRHLANEADVERARPRVPAPSNSHVAAPVTGRFIGFLFGVL